jgi:hypothetical protein
MAGQDNDTYQDRVALAVIEAVIDAGRAHPGAADVHLNTHEALDGVCEAMAALAATFAQLSGDPGHAVAILTRMEERAVSRLRFFAEKVSAGEMAGLPTILPKPKLVR